jgi:hypothetical protein
MTKHSTPPTRTDTRPVSVQERTIGVLIAWLRDAGTAPWDHLSVLQDHIETAIQRAIDDTHAEYNELEQAGEQEAGGQEE